MLGKLIMAFGKSIHAGQKGLVVADYGTMLLVRATDESYPGAHNNSTGAGKYFQVDNRYVKKLKDV